MTIQRLENGPRMSRVVVHNDTVYLAGIVAKDLKKDVKGQTEEVLAEIDRLLAKAGSHKSKILQATIWVPDIRLRGAMNEVWTKWVDPKNLPGRACIEAKLADPAALVEIMVTASK